MEINEKKNAISAMMEASMGKIREMVDSNTVVGEPIVTADGVTLIPVSRLSFGFGCGGGDYGKQPDKLGAGAAAGVRVEPMAFLVVKDGVTRMLPVAPPPSPLSTASWRWCRRSWIVWRASSTRNGKRRISKTKYFRTGPNILG